jgi:hypothetical protein
LYPLEGVFGDMKDMAGAEIVTGEADMAVKDMAGAENTIRNEGKGGG